MNVLAAGADPTGAAPSDAAFQIAANAAGAMYIPEGRYSLLGTTSLSPSTRIYGDGVSSVLLPGTPGMTVFQRTEANAHTPSRLNFDNFAVDCGAIPAVTGIALNLCTFTKTKDVEFRGCLRTIDADRGRFHTVRDVLSTCSPALRAGQLRLWSSTDTEYIYQSIVSGYQISGGIGLWQGVVDESVFIRRGASIQVSDVLVDLLNQNGSPTSFMVLENDCQGCVLSRCQSGTGLNGIVLRPGPGVLASPSYNEIDGCSQDNFSGVGVGIYGLWNAKATKNIIRGGLVTGPNLATGKAIALSHADSTSVLGVKFENYFGQIGTAIDIDHSGNVMIHDCEIDNYAVGINFGPGASNPDVLGNTFLRWGTQFAGTIPGVWGRIRENVNGNPLLSTVTPPVPASGTAIINNTGAPVRAYIRNGSVTQIQHNGITTGLTGGTFPLLVNDSIKLTYSVAPTWAWVSA